MDLHCDEEIPDSPELRRKRRKDYNTSINKLKVYTDAEELLYYLQLLGEGACYVFFFKKGIEFV